MRYFVCLFFALSIAKMMNATVIMERMDFQADPKYLTVKTNKKVVDGVSLIDIDANTFFEADDVTLNIAGYTSSEGKFNEILRSDPISVCGLQKSDDELIKFVFQEFHKFGNLTEGCPTKKAYYYAHNFQIDARDLPTFIPEGEFRVDINATIKENGKDQTVYSSELYFMIKK